MYLMNRRKAFTGSGVAWDLSTAVYASKFADVSSQTTTPYGLVFSSDGTKMYVMKSSSVIFQYSLSSAWDASTATYATLTKDISAEGFFRYFAFNDDGTKMYAVDGNTFDTVFQYTLSTAWNISTATYATKSLSIASEDAGSSAIAFSADGTKAYVHGSINGKIFQYTLSTPWDISTGTYATKSLDVSSEGVAQGIHIKVDGTSVYGISTSDVVFQYDLSTPWDMSTGSYSGKSKDVSSEDSATTGLFFRTNGKSMYVAGNTNNKVFQYTL